MAESGNTPNYNALLKWSLAQTPENYESDHVAAAPIDEERKKWLLEAMSSMTCDFPKRMKVKTLFTVLHATYEI